MFLCNLHEALFDVIVASTPHLALMQRPSRSTDQLLVGTRCMHLSPQPNQQALIGFTRVSHQFKTIIHAYSSHLSHSLKYTGYITHQTWQKAYFM